MELKSVGDFHCLIFVHKEGDIVLAWEMYEKLKNCAQSVTETLLKICMKQSTVDCNVNIGGDVYVYAKAPYRCVQIRQFEESEGILIPTKAGISLKRAEWFVLLNLFQAIDRSVTTPKGSTKCTELHQNQESFFECSECCPSVPSTPKRKKKNSSKLIPGKFFSKKLDLEVDDGESDDE